MHFSSARKRQAEYFVLNKTTKAETLQALSRNNKVARMNKESMIE